MLKLFEDCNYDMAIRTLLKTLKQYCYTADLNNISLISGLHCVSDSGIGVIAARLEEIEGCDTNQMNCAGNRLLAWPLGMRTREQEKVTRESGVLIGDLGDSRKSISMFLTSVFRFFFHCRI